MKRLLSGVLLLLGCLLAQAQHEYTIEGHVEGVKDGTLVSLFLIEGSVGKSIATDSIRNGKFFFKHKAEENGLDQLSLMCTRNSDFPNMALKIYAAPDTKIQVTGNNMLIYTWKVDSPLKEQQEHNKFVEAARDLWDECQRLSIKEKSMRGASNKEQKAIRAKKDSISALINLRELKLMRELPVSDVWLERLHKLSMPLKYDESLTDKEKVLALYKRLNKEQKESALGQEIRINLFPPTVVKEGDDLADADLFDLDGNLYHLTDFKGKHILLDFWSSGCGPCIMSLPEMKEIHEQYKDRLTIISLSGDVKSRWKAASAQHEMTWLNLNDLKQSAGLYAKYGVRSLPYYVLISPEGKIDKRWSGYGKGSLKQKMHRYLDTPKREMSITRQGNTKLVNYPVSESTNTDILEIKQVELADTATIIRFKAYYTPNFWIQVSPNAKLVDSKGASYALKKAIGITPGSHFYLPESGEAEFTLLFEPLSSQTKSFSFTEGTDENDWQIKEIKLTE